MSLFLETIRWHNGRLENLPYHQERLNRTRWQALKRRDELNLAERITAPAGLVPQGVYRCRVVYGEKLESVEFFPYQIRPVRTLRLVEANSLDYAHKYADRTALDALRAGLATDEEVLIVKNGLVTDTTYTNVAFFDGTRWLTPARPLLEGTRRAALLAAGTLQKADLRVADLQRMEQIRLLNAMMTWEEGPKPVLA